MVHVYEENQKLQWLKGDKAGNVEEVVGQDGEWTKFKSGSRISTSLINEFMLPVEGEPLDLSDQETVDKVYQNSQTENKNNKTASKISQSNPIKLLFNKQKKTDLIDLTLNFSINVPSIEIFDIISSTFEKDEVMAELSAFIYNQINSDEIETNLKSSIENLIKDRFKS